MTTTAEAKVPATINNRASPLVQMAQRFSIEPDRMLSTLRGTVIKPDKHGNQATNEEVAAFVIVANQYQLNPFTREIYAFPAKGGGIVPIVGVDGWVSLVNRHPDYDGCEFIEQSTDDGQPLFTTCIMYSKRRTHATKITEWYAECRRDTEPWRGMPRRMLRHKAYIQAARVCFGLAGIFDEDEGAQLAGAYVTEVVEPARTYAKAPPPNGSKVEQLSKRIDPAPVEQKEPEESGSDQSQPPDRQPGDDPPEASDLEAQDCAKRISEGIAAAKTTLELETGPGRELMSNTELLGEMRREALMQEYQKKYRAMTKKGAKA